VAAACVVELPVFHFMGPILKFVGVAEMLHWVMFFFLVTIPASFSQGLSSTAL
jgi:hypothetical protein